MAIFKVGDKVRRLTEYRNVMSWPHGDTVKEVRDITGGGNHLRFDDDFKGGWWDVLFELVEAAPSPVAHVSSRSNDPSTSKTAGKVKRVSLRQRVGGLLCLGYPATGTEIAEQLGARLNSVTPRLAELRREGKIKDSGQRRDKQIVWVLA